MATDRPTMDLRQQLRDRLEEHLGVLLNSVVRATTGMPAGPRRLTVAVEAFWECCYRTRALRAELVEQIRQTQSGAELARLAQIFERMLASELTRCGVREPRALARDLRNEVAAIARAELMASHRLPWQRRRLIGFLESRLGFAACLAPLGAVPAADAQGAVPVPV